MAAKIVSLYSILKNIPLPTVAGCRRTPAYGAARIAHGTVTMGDPREAKYTVAGIAPSMLDERASAVVDARALLTALKSAPTAPILPGLEAGTVSVNGITIPELPGLCVGDIDPMPKLAMACTIVRASGLSVLYSVLPAAGTDITRDSLRSAWIDGGDAGPLTAWATDGHRAHGAPMPEDSLEGVVPRRVPIPSRDLALAKAVKALSIGLGETRANAGCAGIEIHVPGGIIIRSQGPARGIQAPDISQVIPSGAASGAMPVPLTLAKQLEAARVAVKVAGHDGAPVEIHASGNVCLLTSEGTNPAPMDLRGGMAAILKWHRENPGKELYRADVPTCGEAAGDVIARANPKYLIDALAFTGAGPDVTLSTRGEYDPIKVARVDGRIALVMPVR